MPASVSTHRVSLFCLALAMLGGILFFGLRPKDLTLANNVNWLSDQNGIHFRKYGIAYSPAFVESSDQGISEKSGLSIEIAVKPEIPHPDHFSFILVLDNGIDSKQLLVGQWRSWLVLMNGDDYAHKKRLKRLAVNTAALPPGILFLTIVSGTDGTYLYCNGKPAAAKEDVALRSPAGEKARLIVGNSAYGKHSWHGELYGLAIYNRRLAPDVVSAHYRQWSGERRFGYALKGRPLAAYFFDEKGGELARDHAGGAHLEVPRKIRVLRRQVLALPWDSFEFNRNFMGDILVNIIGFIPFGFVLAAALSQWGGRLKTGAFVIAVSFGILTSLFIEISQSWMPSRSSTLLDLILNSAGALAGALAFWTYSRGRREASVTH